MTALFRWTILLLSVAGLLSLSACGGSGNSSSTSSQTSSGSGSGTGSSSSSNAAPTVSGDPGFATTDAVYTFKPVVADPEGDTLTYQAGNLPSWLSFDVNTGTFSGTPSAADEGVYEDVTFTVSDGSNVVTEYYTFVTSPDPLTAAINSGDHRYVFDEQVYWDALYAELDAGIAAGTFDANEIALKPFLQNLQNDTFTFNLVNDCLDIGRGSECTNATYVSEFRNEVRWLKSVFDGYDAARYDLFADPVGPRYQKLLVLLADHVRTTVTYPLSTGYQQTFLRSFFADHIVHVYRSINPAQPDMGNFSRSDFHGITPMTVNVNLTSRKPFRAAGVYAFPGKTMTVTRSDSSAVTVKIAVNSVRDLAVRQYLRPDRTGLEGYNRPKYLQSPWIEIGPGETISFTSPYGGPVQVSFDTNDQPVALSFGNVGQHPIWRSSADTTSFLAGLDADEYDWAELVTRDIEVHTPVSYAKTMLLKVLNGDPQAVSDEIYNGMIKYEYALAGYQGTGIDVIPEVQQFATDNGFTLKTMDYVQHFNADQAACSTACGGNPIDTEASFDAYSPSTDMHELGHSVEPLWHFDGSYLHTTTDLFPNYAEYRTFNGDGVGANGTCYDRPYQDVFNILQASRGETDPATYMHADIVANDEHGLIMYQELMAMAQNEGTLTNGWDLVPEWEIIQREYEDAILSDSAWAAKSAALGFGSMTRTDAMALSADDLQLIVLSKVVNRNLTAWLELWGNSFSDPAKTLVASLSYTDAPLVYYAMTGKQSCTSFTAPTVAIDGVSAWPL